MNILHILKDYENQLGIGNVIAASDNIYDDVVNEIKYLECTDTHHLIKRAHSELVKAKADLLFVSMYNDPNQSLNADIQNIISGINSLKTSIDCLLMPSS